MAGLETLAGPETLDELCGRFGADRIIFSLDLRDGRPLGDGSQWGGDPLQIAARARAAGITRMIVLDLARVGTDNGVATLELASCIRSTLPGVLVITGGGVRNGPDLRSLAASGIAGVLLATALHRETIGREEIRSIAGSTSGDRLSREVPRG